MDGLADEEGSDIASDWVKKLRLRFTQLGLSSPGGSETDHLAYNDNKTVENTQTIPPDYQVTKTSRFSDSRQGKIANNSTCDSAFSGEYSREFGETRNGTFPGTSSGNSTSSDSQTKAMPTTCTTGNTLLDLEHLREKRLAYFQDGCKFTEGNKSLSNEKLELKCESLHNDTESTVVSSDEAEINNAFYIRPESANSTSSWGKHDWELNRFDEAQSPESDGTPRLKSSEENLDLILDWWGLKDLTKTPELRKYLPTSRKSADTSKKTISNSVILKVGCDLDESYKVRDLEDDFHVFPIGFDETELAKNNFQNTISDVCYSSSDEDSDFTVDDPVTKPRSPRAANGIFLANSPRNLASPRNLKSWSRLSQSKSPPVPQIRGSLYHEFSNQGNNDVSKQMQQMPDVCTTVADDEVPKWKMHQRPRSSSQPSVLTDNFDKCDIFSHYEDNDQSNDMLCGFISKNKSVNLGIDFEQNGFLKKDTDRSKEGNLCDFVGTLSKSVLQDSTSIVPKSSGQQRSLDESGRNVCVCPECSEINSFYANWCIECGMALVNVKSIKQDTHSYTTQNKSNSSKELSEDLIEAKKLSLNEKSNRTESLLNEKNPKRNSGKGLKQDGRRWEKSSLAWSTYKDSHLSKPSAVKNYKNKSKKNIVTADGNCSGRPRSASCKNSGNKDEHADGSYTHNPSNVVGSWPKSNKMRELKNKKKNAWNPGKHSEMRVKGNKAIGKKDMKIDLSGLDDYGEITQMIRSNRGCALPYFCLPDEIILHIFRHLSNLDLARCSQVCRQLNRICQDECLWKTIVLRKNHNICDEFLEKIGSKKPVSLNLIQCRGNLVTAGGLRELFRRCADNLEELNFSGCNGGQLIGESILLHVALRCSKLQSVDASWSNVGDNGIEALVQNVDRLECLCLNGCQAITDHSLKVIADKHGDSLRTFEIFGCFNVSTCGIKRLGQKCPNLQTLNLGQCYKITSAAIGQLVSHLESIVNLDLRGCKQARDTCVKTIAKHCPLLVNLVLANCPLISDVAMAEIATNLPSVRCLDICGCVKVTDHGVQALARSCNRLNYLDLSSTSITQKSVMLLANYCSQNLESLKLSFCVDVTDDSVSRLVKHCKRMTTLHLYGCKRLRNMKALQKLNQSLKLEF